MLSMVASHRPVRAVLFDMTGTLHPQHQFRRGVELAATEISPNLSSVSASEIVAAFGPAFRDELMKRVEVPFYLMADLYHQTLSAALTTVGANATEKLVLDSVESLRRNLAASIGPQEGAAEVLSVLRAAGLTTGIVSVNDEADLKSWIEACGFEAHVDFALSSEAARSCKPDQGIFTQAVALAECDADEIVFVGDSREMDIRGANRAGMRSVLTMQGVFTPPGQPAVYDADDSPDFTIGHIRELLGLVLPT